MLEEELSTNLVMQMICEECAELHGLKYNILHLVCMIFKYKNGPGLIPDSESEWK